MKILVLSMNFSPELTGIGKYSGDMVDGLLARGHQVAVVCAPPYYPAWKVEAGYHRSSYQVERPKPGLTIYRCPVWVPQGLGGFKRLLHLASFALSSLPLMLLLVLWRPAAVFAVMPALFAAPWGRLTAWLAGATSWLHVQDLEVDAAFELGLLKGGFARRSVLAFERAVLSGYDRVSTISRRMLKQLVAKGVALERAELMPNGVDMRHIRPQCEPSPLRHRLGLGDDQIVCLYSGTMNRKQGLHVLVDAARRLQHLPQVVFVISGNGELRGSLEASAAELGNVRFLDLCPAEQLNDLLNAADIHLLPQLRGAADLVMPSKLSAMLASGRPTIAAAAHGTEIASVVEGRGLVVEPESSDAFVAAIERLAADAEERLRFGRAARSFAEEALDNDALYDLLDAKLTRAIASAPVVVPGRRALRA